MGNTPQNNREVKEANKGYIIKHISLWAEFTGEFTWMNGCLSYFLLSGKGAGVFVHQPPPVIG